jgi:predicted metal-dependent peptidase
MEPKTKKDLEEKATRAITVARVKLLLQKDPRSVFFATLGMKLRPRIDWAGSTMATDGKHLFYNPEFTMKLTNDVVLGVVTHEILHCVYSHMTRRGHRAPRPWNISCDASINQIVLNSGYVLPSGCVVPGKAGTPFEKWPLGKCAEEYYSLIPRKKGGGPGDIEDMETGPSGDDPGGCGEVRDAAPDDAGQREAEGEWKVSVAQAANAAKQRGKLPGDLERLVDEIVHPKVDYRELLREFLRSHAKNDYCWARPNRRYVHAGLYLPSLHSEELGNICVTVDTSGSIGQAELDEAAGEIQGVLECLPSKVWIIYHDSKVQHVQEWNPSDGKLILEPKGGGGSSFLDTWRWIAEQGIEPACILAFTDMQVEFGEDPGIPIMWLTKNEQTEPPFGRKVVVR